MTTQSVLTRIPENTNFLQTNKFTFTFPKLPFLRYYAQHVVLPGVGTTPVEIPLPFTSSYRHGDTLVFGELPVNVIVDEDMQVWEETYNWLNALTKPRDYAEYGRFRNLDGSLYHDATLTVNTNANLPNIRFLFRNCHPISMGQINFSLLETAEAPITLDVVFRYDYYDMERL